MSKKVKQIDLFNEVVKEPVVIRKRRCMVCKARTRFMFFCSKFCREIYRKSFE